MRFRTAIPRALRPPEGRRVKGVPDVSGRHSAVPVRPPVAGTGLVSQRPPEPPTRPFRGSWPRWAQRPGRWRPPMRARRRSASSRCIRRTQPPSGCRWYRPRPANCLLRAARARRTFIPSQRALPATDGTRPRRHRRPLAGTRPAIYSTPPPRRVRTLLDVLESTASRYPDAPALDDGGPDLLPRADVSRPPGGRAASIARGRRGGSGRGSDVVGHRGPLPGDPRGAHRRRGLCPGGRRRSRRARRHDLGRGRRLRRAQRRDAVHLPAWTRSADRRSDSAPGRRCLDHLHLRLHRQAEGRGDQPPLGSGVRRRRGGVVPACSKPLGPGDPRAGRAVGGLRRLLRGDVAGLALRRLPRPGAATDRAGRRRVGALAGRARLTVVSTVPTLAALAVRCAVPSCIFTLVGRGSLPAAALVGAPTAPDGEVETHYPTEATLSRAGARSVLGQASTDWQSHCPGGCSQSVDSLGSQYGECSLLSWSSAACRAWSADFDAHAEDASQPVPAPLQRYSSAGTWSPRTWEQPAADFVDDSGLGGKATILLRSTRRCPAQGWWPLPRR